MYKRFVSRYKQHCQRRPGINSCASFRDQYGRSPVQDMLQMVTMAARSMAPLSRTSLRPAVRPGPVCGLRAEMSVLHNKCTSCHEQASSLDAV